MNAAQRRKYARRASGDHFHWPLGTLVMVQSGHHSPAAVDMVGKVGKHGYPCRSRIDCIVDFATPVMDATFGAARFSHYTKFRHLRRLDGRTWNEVPQ